MSTNLSLRQRVEQAIDWSEPKKQNTYRGPCYIQTGEPTPEFWGLWRSDKAALQAMKVAPKLVGDKWIVNWYEDEADRDRRLAMGPAPEAPSNIVVQVTTASMTRVWSVEQQAIFTWFRTGKGNRVIRARAGTGKTTTIKTGLSYAPEERMLYAVFNKKNQIEAAEAIADPRVEIKTLHSVGYDFIRQVWPKVAAHKDVEESRVEKVVGEQAPQAVKTQVKKLVSFAKNTLVNPSLAELEDLAEERDVETPSLESEENGGWTRSRLASMALQVLELSKKKDKLNRISFDDMVWLPVAMGWVRSTYDLVVVDEAQDMNLPQLLMAKQACKTTGRICVVGDDRQAIYHFRGAASNGIDMMKESLQAEELGLTTTYRCPKAVVALAAAFVPDYKAADTAPDGIVETVPVAGVTAIVKIGDAILSRANAPLMPLCLGLLRKGVSARIEGRDLGKALIDIVNRLKAQSVPQFMQKIETWGEKQTARFNGTKNFEQKAEQIRDQVETLKAIAENATSVTEIVTRLETLFQDSTSASKPAVVLSTVHKAKGLEWNKTFLLSSTFMRKRPASAPPMSPEAEAARTREETNIYYVALTRAKAHLVLCSGEVR